MIDESKKLSLFNKGNGGGFTDIIIGGSGSGGVGEFRRHTGPYGGFPHDLMTGNWTGWERLQHVLDSATFTGTF